MDEELYELLNQLDCNELIMLFLWIKDIWHT